MAPKWSKTQSFWLQMLCYPSLRCSLASSFDLGTNLKLSGVDSLQLSCQSRFRFSLFSNIAHFTEHCKTQCILMILQSSALHTRCEKEAIDEAKPCSQREVPKANFANFYITWRPFLVEKSTLEGQIWPPRAHRTTMSKESAKKSQNGLPKGPQNWQKSTQKL